MICFSIAYFGNSWTNMWHFLRPRAFVWALGSDQRTYLFFRVLIVILGVFLNLNVPFWLGNGHPGKSVVSSLNEIV